jgi:hypothetical protein
MFPSWQVQRGIVIAAGGLLSLSACTASRGGFDPTLLFPKPDSAEVAALAQNYRFVNPIAPIPSLVPLPPGTAVPDADEPTITIARAVPIRPPGPSGKVILALVRSDKPYQHLGIAVGDNYVWRDATDADPKRWRTFMVPVSFSSNAKKLKRDTTAYSSGDHTQPRLVRRVTNSVSLGVCLDDPACGTGHCGYGDIDSFR